MQVCLLHGYEVDARHLALQRAAPQAPECFALLRRIHASLNAVWKP